MKKKEDLKPFFLKSNNNTLSTRASLINSLKFNDVFLQKLSFTSLKALTIAYCQKISEQALVDFLAKKTELESISILDNHLVTDKVLQSIPFSCNRLNLSNYSFFSKDLLTDRGLSNCIRRCKKIKFLSLYGRKNLTDHSIFQISKYSEELESFLFPGEKNKFLSLIAFQTLLQNCKNLNNLHLGGSLFSSKGKIDLGFCFSLEKMKHLNLSFCSQLNENSFFSIPSKNNLQILNLTGCNHIGDEALARISEKCNNLTQLKLSFCENITFKGIKAIISNCKKLEILDISRCKIFSKKNILEILEQLPSLTFLNILGCKIASYDFIKKMQSTYPNTLFRSSCEQELIAI